MQLILVRHGESTANLLNQMQGHGDAALTKRGEQQARLVTQRLKRAAQPIAAIYASPLKRALSTAQTLHNELQIPLYLHEDLQEVDMGELEGLPAATMMARAPKELDERYPGGETLRQFGERVMRTFKLIAHTHPGEIVVVVSHGGVISTALSYCKYGHIMSWRDYIPSNCAISIVEFGDTLSVISFNDCSHFQTAA